MINFQVIPYTQVNVTKCSLPQSASKAIVHKWKKRSSMLHRETSSLWNDAAVYNVKTPTELLTLNTDAQPFGEKSSSGEQR